MNIQFVGCGNMGKEVLIMLGNYLDEVVDDSSIHIVTKSGIFDVSQLLPNLQQRCTYSDVQNDADIVFLAIKPQQLSEIDFSCYSAETLFVSMLAGTSIKSLSDATSSSHIMRIMPSLMLRNGNSRIASYMPSKPENTQSRFVSFVYDACKHQNNLRICPQEEDINKFTALVGSAPAYYYLFAEYMAQAGHSLGIDADLSKKFAGSVLRGAPTLLDSLDLQDRNDFLGLVNRVASRGGTTQAAIKTFEDLGLQDIVQKAVQSANERAGELATGGSTSQTSSQQDIISTLQKSLKSTKNAAQYIAQCSHQQRNKLLNDIADALENNADSILDANQLDCAACETSDPLYDRLLLTSDRIQSMAQGCRDVALLSDPLDYTQKIQQTATPSISIQKVAVPLGVVGCIYEARPNVTIDMIALAFKSGNALVLKGSHHAHHSNKALVAIVHEVLVKHTISSDILFLFPPEREYLPVLLQAEESVDVIIPRGGKGLIDAVRKQSSIPTIETGASVVHMYIDESLKESDFDQTIDCIINAKVQRPSVCNAVDMILVAESMVAIFIPRLLSALQKHAVMIHTDDIINKYTKNYPTQLIGQQLDESMFDKEYLGLGLGVMCVSNVKEAVIHINTYGLHHSDAIFSSDTTAIQYFLNNIDSAVVYANTSTRFSDGSCFGFGSEIGISTQKLHARGPMGCAVLTTYKYVVTSNFAVRR